jgi:hypothetical protein
MEQRRDARPGDKGTFRPFLTQPSYAGRSTAKIVTKNVLSKIL